MWTDTTRALHARKGLALPSNLTDGEWAVLEPFFPLPSHVGRLRKWPMRRNVEAILYLLRGGLPWRMLPPCFPPASTVRRWFYLWRDSGLWKTVNHYLLTKDFERTIESATAWLFAASVQMLTRRTAKPCNHSG